MNWIMRAITSLGMNFRKVFEGVVNPRREYYHTDIDVPAPLLEYFLVGGAIFAVSTNSPLILAAARKSFLPAATTPSSVQGQLRLSVNESDLSGPPWPKPYFGGLDHLIFAGFNASSGLLLDVRRCRGIGLFSLPMGSDKAYWTSMIFPTIVGFLGPSVRVVPLHCACLVRERDGSGLLLAGGSGVGKSTLTVALAKAGLRLLSDDWTYFTIRGGRAHAWGLPTPVKLLPDAASHFSELTGRQPAASLNGELVFEVDPEQVFGVSRSLRCEPRWLFFLERQAGPEFRFNRVVPREAAERLKRDTPQLWPELVMPRQEVIAALTKCHCGSLRYGAGPQKVAEFIVHLLETSRKMT